MDIWDEIKTLAGYQSGRGGVDSYGVDHSGFTRAMNQNIKVHGWQEKINWRRISANKEQPKKTILSSALTFGAAHLKITTASALQTLSKISKTLQIG